MTAFSAELDTTDLPEGWVWCDRRELQDRYAVPNAFRFVDEALERRMGYF